MKIKLDNIFSSFGIKNQRSKNIARHVSMSVFYKVGAVAANFLLVPLTIRFLNNENYGIWLTLSSFIAWFSMFDVGLGNGLRNKLAEAIALDKPKLAQAYVSTTYYAIGIISFLLFLSFFFVNFFIDWADLFNANASLNPDLRLLMPIVFGFFSLQLIVRLVTTIYLANQVHSIQNKIHFFTQVFSLIAIWMLTKTTNSSLLLFGIVFSSLPVIILLVLNRIAFTGVYKNLKPKLSLFHKRYLKDLVGIGLNFFIIQIAVLVIFSTDNLIISKLFSPADVVPYNVAFKYFSILIMAYTILITPFWSSFTEAYAQNDYKWIRNSVRTIQRIWFMVPLILILMVMISKRFYFFWVGDKVSVSLGLSLSMALYVLLLTFTMVYNYFINGIGKIKLHLYTSIFSMIINIPLSIFFAKYLNLGVQGVILATCVSLVVNTIFMPIQYVKLINKKAYGIWGK